ncbi:unnamed protein product, partial [Closterium sp. NIES-64]
LCHLSEQLRHQSSLRVIPSAHGPAVAPLPPAPLPLIQCTRVAFPSQAMPPQAGSSLPR